MIMNNLKTFSLIFLSTASMVNAQDIAQSKKAIDAEQFEKAKTMLKSIVNSNPDDGYATFLLGNVYLEQEAQDSAKIYFDKGLTRKNNGNYNYIGLGQIDLENNNKAGADAKFALATKDMRRKDIQEFEFIAEAYMNQSKPDYKTALTYLKKAKVIDETNPNIQMAFGDAYYGEKNQNEAYAAYRNAYEKDNSLIRAKMQLGVLLKGAKAYTEAVKAYDNVIAIDPNYGPVYRELAETYYYWGNNDPKKYNEYIQKALQYYEKYMSLTDYSLASRMRHADFLILTKDYKALEIEANQMKELDKVNPRILRYLGYAAYENGKPEVAIKSLNDFIANPNNKVIARDYFYLGLAKIMKSNNVEAETVNVEEFNAGIVDLKKSVEMEITMTNDLSAIGKKFYEQKLYNEAAAIFEIAVTNLESKNNLLDNFYLGNSIYFNNTKKGFEKVDPIALAKADVAFGKVIEASPTTQDAYLYRARTNLLLENDEMMAKYYLEYIDVVTKKGPEEVEKNKTKFVEAYNTIAASYAIYEKPKAIEFFNKAIAIDPTNEYALQSLKALK